MAAPAAAPAALALLEEQLRAYKRITSQETSAFALPKLTFSGKVDGQGRMNTGRLADDLCLALQLAVFWATYAAQGRAAHWPEGVPLSA